MVMSHGEKYKKNTKKNMIEIPHKQELSALTLSDHEIKG